MSLTSPKNLVSSRKRDFAGAPSAAGTPRSGGPKTSGARQYALNCGGVAGPGEEVALHLVAPGQAQQYPLLVPLDPLGQDFHAKRMAERDDRLNDCAGIAGDTEGGHERAVDFEQVERKFCR